MFCYQNLSDVEFEALAQDIMERKLNTPLHIFAQGRDGGIDLIDDVAQKNHMVQVKHYIKAGFSGLLASLKKEISNVKRHRPKQYYVVCSTELTPANTEAVFGLFKDYMCSTHNIISLKDIDAFLQMSENQDIVRRHYKLWLSATEVLSSILSQNVHLDSQTLLATVRERFPRYVETEAYRQSRDILAHRHILMLIGSPGVGKTVTSEMLVLYFANQGYHIRYTTDGTNLNELKRAISSSPKELEIILLDDCLGQCYFKMKETQENELIALIRYISMSQNKILLMNSRVTIFQEAKASSEDFEREVQGTRLKVHVLNMDSITNIEKAKIFYNHLYFSSLPPEYFAEIRRDKHYRDIVLHPNYSPRIIEHITSSKVPEIVPVEQYFPYILSSLNQPDGIWRNEFERRLQPTDRIFLTTLYSLTDTMISSNLLRDCFYRRLQLQPGIDITLDNFSASLKRLNESFVKAISCDGTQNIGVINPSVNDFLRHYLDSPNNPERQALGRSIISIEQAQRLLPDPDSFLAEKYTNGSILEFKFENDRKKMDFIVFAIQAHRLRLSCYQQIVLDYLADPHTISDFKTTCSKAKTLLALLSPELSTFYKLGLHLANPDYLENILSDLDINEIVPVLVALDPLFGPSSQRKAYLKSVKPLLLETIELFTTDIDAASASDGLDISEIIRDNATEEGYPDIRSATLELEDIIIDFTEQELQAQLNLLPPDIQALVDLKHDVYFSVFGAESVINSCFKPEWDFDDMPHGQPSSSTVGGDEIDYVFNR